MKKQVFPYAILVIAIAFFCPSCHRNQDTIRIGAILPLTGVQSGVGIGTQRGLLLAIDSIRKLYPDKSVELYLEDYASESKNISSCAIKLLQTDRVNAVITNTTLAAEVVTPLAERNRIIHFTLSPDVKILEASPNNYRIFYRFEDEARKVCDFIERWDLQNTYFFALDNPAFRNMIEQHILPNLKDRKITVEYYDYNNPNFTSQLAKIRAARPDGIYLCPLAGHAQTLVNQLNKNDIKPDTYKLLGSYSFSWVKKDYLLSLNDYYFITPSTVFSIDPNIENHFVRTFGEVPTFDSYYAFDNLMILSSLLVQTTDPAEFGNLFNRSHEYEGVSGKIRFVGHNDTQTDVILTHIADHRHFPVP